MSHSDKNNNDDVYSNLSLGLQLSSSGGDHGCRFKGVVPQQNGHWGAQIYAKHQRIWLGTFKTEREAAMAYDSASIKLRSGDSYRNLSISPDHLALEMDFQSHFSVDALLVMIKDGSYQSRLGDFSRSWRSQSDHQPGPLNSHYPGGVMRVGVGGEEEIVYKDYFEKELTPSDVGKLNRLVIPKKYALKFFPQATDPAGFVNGGDIPDADLEFFDRTMKRWRFRYCYWKSSQSFVFTKGWNKFVKEKEIKTKDVVVFYNCETKPMPGTCHKVSTFTMIDYRQFEGEEVGADGVGPSGTVNGEEEEEEDEGEMNQEENVEEVQGQRRVFRLFGVDIM